jgi:hypothetical protein
MNFENDAANKKDETGQLNSEPVSPFALRASTLSGLATRT